MRHNTGKRRMAERCSEKETAPATKEAGAANEQYSTEILHNKWFFRFSVIK